MSSVRCAIWGTGAEEMPVGRDGNRFDSDRTAGLYFITGSAGATIQGLNDVQKARLTSWLVDQRSSGVRCPEIDTSIVDLARTLGPKGVPDRADRLLRQFSEKSRWLGEPVRTFYGQMNDCLAISESVRTEEVQFLADMLEKRGWIGQSKLMGAVDATVLAEGYQHLEDVRNNHLLSSQGFVAMWFDASVQTVFDEGVAAGILDAGYVPMRIDKKAHNNKIDDEIIAEIRRSRFLVADFTHGDDGARGGVYYEAGFAHGLGKPVIFTVRADMISKAHFDTRQYAHILWNNATDLRKQLADRISATIGDGAGKVSNRA